MRAEALVMWVSRVAGGRDGDAGCLVALRAGVLNDDLSAVQDSFRTLWMGF